MTRLVRATGMYIDGIPVEESIVRYRLAIDGVEMGDPDAWWDDREEAETARRILERHGVGPVDIVVHVAPVDDE